MFGQGVAVASGVSCNFSGFPSPVNAPPTVNTGKAGRTYPANGCYTLFVTLNSNQVLSAYFNLSK